MSHRRQKSLRGVAFAVLLISLIACGVTPDDRKVATTNEPASSPGPERGLVYFLPTYVPESLKVEKGSVQTGFKDPGAYSAVIGRPASESEFIDTVSVKVSEAAADREVGEQELKAIKMVDVGGHQARLRDSEMTGTVLDWHQDGLSIGLNGPSGAEELLLKLARGLKLSPSQASATALGDIPNGYEVVGESRMEAFDRNSYSITLSASKRDSSGLGIMSVIVVPSGLVPATLLGSGGKLQLRQVRGLPAALGEHTAKLPRSWGPSGAPSANPGLARARRPPGDDAGIDVRGRPSADGRRA